MKRVVAAAEFSASANDVMIHQLVHQHRDTFVSRTMKQMLTAMITPMMVLSEASAEAEEPTVGTAAVVCKPLILVKHNLCKPLTKILVCLPAC